MAARWASDGVHGLSVAVGSDSFARVPQLVGTRGARIRGLTCGNARDGGMGSCVHAVKCRCAGCLCWSDGVEGGHQRRGRHVAGANRGLPRVWLTSDLWRRGSLLEGCSSCLPLIPRSSVTTWWRSPVAARLPSPRSPRTSVQRVLPAQLAAPRRRRGRCPSRRDVRGSREDP